METFTFCPNPLPDTPMGLGSDTQIGAPEVPELSMGMSGDFDAAVVEGATVIRLGTALFGPRVRQT